MNFAQKWKILQKGLTSIDESMQAAHEDGAAGIKARGGATDGVAVGERPGDHLHLLAVNTPARHLEVVLAGVHRIMGAVQQESLDRLL